MKRNTKNSLRAHFKEIILNENYRKSADSTITNNLINIRKKTITKRSYTSTKNNKEKKHSKFSFFTNPIFSSINTLSQVITFL